MISFPSDIIVNTDFNSATALVIWQEPPARDNSGQVTRTSTHKSHTNFPIGTTTVSYTASDPSGNFVARSFTVTVVGKQILGDSKPIVPGVSGKLRCSRLSILIFQNGKTQQCDIFRLNTYNFCLLVCEISTPYGKCNESYELEENDGSNGIQTIKQQILIDKRILSSKSILTHQFSHRHNFSNIYHILLKLYTHLHSQKKKGLTGFSLCRIWNPLS